MQLVIDTWNSISINNGNPFSSTFPPGQLVNLSANGVTVPRAALFPFLSTKVLTSHVIVLRVLIAPSKDIPTNRELLKAIFNIQDTVRHNLVVKDIVDSNRQWYLTGFPVRVVEDKPGLYFVTLQIEMPVWRTVAPAIDSWSITASGQTISVTPFGNVEVPPTFSITPTSAKSSGLTRRRWVSIYNKMDTSFIKPLEITGGGFDTAAEVAGGDMQADGDDFRVWVDGVETDRWLHNMNTAATLCWINIALSPKKEGTTSVTISNIGAVTTISLSRTRSNLAFLQAMIFAVNKVVLIDSEAFLFTGVNLATYQLTGVSRSAKNTSAATHTAPATVRWIEHDVWIVYGDSTLSAPEVDDKLKPMWETSSTNTSLSFTKYFDDTASRPGAWQSEVNATRSQASYPFTGNENTFVNPAEKLGLAMMANANPVPQQEMAQLDWLFTHPCGMTNVSFAGKRYTLYNSWPAVAGLQVLQEEVAWFTVKNITVPTVLASWEAISETVNLGGTYETIRFAFDGALDIISGNMAMIQFDTVVLTIASGNVPAVSVGSEQNIAYLNFTLTNNTTGLFITCALPIPLNDTLVIDCENKIVTVSNGERAFVNFSSVRNIWLDLLASANTLKYDDTGTGNVTLDIIHRDRTM
jgi:hypothetical protein